MINFEFKNNEFNRIIFSKIILSIIDDIDNRLDPPIDDIIQFLDERDYNGSPYDLWMNTEIVYGVDDLKVNYDLPDSENPEEIVEYMNIWYPNVFIYYECGVGVYLIIDFNN